MILPERTLWMGPGRSPFFWGWRYGVASRRGRDTHAVLISQAGVVPDFSTRTGQAGLIQPHEDPNGPSGGHFLQPAYCEPFNPVSRKDNVGLAREVQMQHVLALDRGDVLAIPGVYR